jgi:integrase
MASVFKRGRWVDAKGQQCIKDTPGAKWVKSRFYTIVYTVDGIQKRAKGYTDRQATEQLAAKLEKAAARGEQGLVDPYKEHRKRSFREHLNDWVTEFRHRGVEKFGRQCDFALTMIASECGWTTLTSVTPESFIRWRETASFNTQFRKLDLKSDGGKMMKYSATSLNDFRARLFLFFKWMIRRKRIPANPLAEVPKVKTVGELRHQRRALKDDEIDRLLSAVTERHCFVYQIALMTGLRRSEIRQLRWGDLHLNAPKPYIQLRAEATKAKRADVLPIRADLAEIFNRHRGDSKRPEESVCGSVPRSQTHMRNLIRAEIPYTDERGRYADFHALRFTFGTRLAKAGVAPRIAMKLMRHKSIHLTMHLYIDDDGFDLNSAVEKMPSINAPAEAPNINTTAHVELPPDSPLRQAKGYTEKQVKCDNCSDEYTLHLMSNRPTPLKRLCPNCRGWRLNQRASAERAKQRMREIADQRLRDAVAMQNHVGDCPAQMTWAMIYSRFPLIRPAQFYKLLAAGRFPQPDNREGQMPRWQKTTIDRWVESLTSDKAA